MEGGTKKTDDGFDNCIRRKRVEERRGTDRGSGRKGVGSGVGRTWKRASWRKMQGGYDGKWVKGRRRDG